MSAEDSSKSSPSSSQPSPSDLLNQILNQYKTPPWNPSLSSPPQERYSGKHHQLVPGKLRGYRLWKISTGELLRSVTLSMHVWGSPEITAECYLGFPTRGEANCRVTGQTPPAAGCQCGIYASHTVGGLSEYWHISHVLGVIEASGQIELGTHGFRAQHAKIVAVAPLQTYRVIRHVDIVQVANFNKYSRIAYPQYPTFSITTGDVSVPIDSELVTEEWTQWTRVWARVSFFDNSEPRTVIEEFPRIPHLNLDGFRKWAVDRIYRNFLSGMTLLPRNFSTTYKGVRLLDNPKDIEREYPPIPVDNLLT